MKEGFQSAVLKFLEQPTSDNKKTVESYLDAYPDYLIRNLPSIASPSAQPTLENDARIPLARIRYSTMPFDAGVFVHDSDIVHLDELPDSERLIMQFRQKQEFKGQKPYSVISFRSGQVSDRGDTTHRRWYRDRSEGFWELSKLLLGELIESKVDLPDSVYSAKDVELRLASVDASEDVLELKNYRNNWIHPSLSEYDDYRVADRPERFLTSRDWPGGGVRALTPELSDSAKKLDWLEQFSTAEEEWLLEPTWKDFLVDLEAGDPKSPLGAKSVRKVCLVNSQFPGLPVTIRSLTLDQSVRGGIPVWGDGPAPENPNDRWVIENTMPDVSPQFFRRLAYFLDATFES